MSIFPPMAGSARQAIEDLKEYGIALLPELLTGNKLREARDEVLEGASDNLLTLLGYRTEVLGTVYGRSPR